MTHNEFKRRVRAAYPGLAEALISYRRHCIKRLHTAARALVFVRRHRGNPANKRLLRDARIEAEDGERRLRMVESFVAD
jgi:hypothetical protein